MYAVCIIVVFCITYRTKMVEDSKTTEAQKFLNKISELQHQVKLHENQLSQKENEV